MLLQIALDDAWEISASVARAVQSSIDIIEIGTPLIYHEGMAIAHRLRREFPRHIILADLKIMDAGETEASIAFEAGCDIVSVLAVAHPSTVLGTIRAARRFGKRVMADLIQAPDPVESCRKLIDMGCDIVCVHTAHDIQSQHTTPLQSLQRLRQVLPDAPLAVAGGISASTIDDVAAWAPRIVIVGSAITGAADPAGAAQEIRNRMDAYAHI